MMLVVTGLQTVLLTFCRLFRSSRLVKLSDEGHDSARIRS